MTEPHEDLPEIALDEILDERGATPATPATRRDAAHAPGEIDIDFDFGASDDMPAVPVTVGEATPRAPVAPRSPRASAPTPSPRPASRPTAAVPATASLDADVGFDLDVDLAPQGAVQHTVDVAPADEPMLEPDLEPAAPLARRTPPPPPASPAATKPASGLDLDALLSDMEIPEVAAPADTEIELTESAAAAAAAQTTTAEIPAAAAAVPAADVDAQTATPQLPAFPAMDVETPHADAPPPLPLLADEPAARSALSTADFPTPQQTIATLEKIAGPTFDPERTRAALTAAFSGEALDVRMLPDSREMVVGLARALVEDGMAVERLVDAVMATLLKD
ncbi:MAG: hypothetical protein HY903_01115 [Deltaproteobacteria bacterium]|nr:hypothetical protein [Deltaproteobacteria bacterium]